ncbi:DUF4397 domain-containing protein [Wenzhouxiangella sp. XN24]|uniref:DUF4397 domain-containing protein n=1 Tax=Wenzhouxiangella sp. XN24 TaxID=2713569 RepID=UPI0013EB771B|nr:DUF4397 domain-containing protein [Wenzhouxiangella sp. XN24]NGX14951.1 DUF4397 domain-containing protein [Wenzhouxiangella sp. XN24]
MRHPVARLAAVVLLTSIASCSGDGADFIWFKVMHAVPDAPVVRVSFDDYVFRRNTAYGISTNEGGESLLSGADPTALMTAEYLEPNAEVGGTLLTVDVPVEKDSLSAVILAGSFDAPEAITVVGPRRPRPLASLYFQFAHATPSLPALDVYVTAPDTELTSTAPFATIAPLDHSKSLEVPFGATRIRLTNAGTFDVVMDTGEIEFAQLPTATGPGAEWLFAIAPTILPGPSPVFLIAGSTAINTRFNDQGTPATARAWHASPGAPPADLVAVTEPDQVLFSDIPFGTRTARVALPEATTELQFRESGTPANVLASDEFEYEVPTQYEVFLVEPPASARTFRVETVVRSIAGQSQVRLAHLAPDREFLLVYLTTDEQEAPSPATRVFPGQPFGTATNYIPRTPGDYFLTITEIGDEDGAEENVLIGPVPVTLADGDAATFAVFPPENEGETEVLEIFPEFVP